MLGAVIGDDPLAQRDRALLELLYGTGIRISEAVGLDLGDLDLDEGVARVVGKGDKERVVPVGRSAQSRARDLHGRRPSRSRVAAPVAPPTSVSTRCS